MSRSSRQRFGSMRSSTLQGPVTKYRDKSQHFARPTGEAGEVHQPASQMKSEIPKGQGAFFLPTERFHSSCSNRREHGTCRESVTQTRTNNFELPLRTLSGKPESTDRQIPFRPFPSTSLPLPTSRKRCPSSAHSVLLSPATSAPPELSPDGSNQSLFGTRIWPGTEGWD